MYYNLKCKFRMRMQISLYELLFFCYLYFLKKYLYLWFALTSIRYIWRLRLLHFIFYILNDRRFCLSFFVAVRIWERCLCGGHISIRGPTKLHLMDICKCNGKQTQFLLGIRNKLKAESSLGMGKMSMPYFCYWT